MVERDEPTDQNGADGLVVSEQLDLLTANLALRGYIKQESSGQWRVTEAGRQYLKSFDNHPDPEAE